MFFTEFVELPTNSVPLETITNYLFEMTSGLDCFPEALEDVALWTAWFKYMMPYLVSRSHEHYVHFLLEDLITAFIRVYEMRIDDEYSGFRLDALSSVGQAIMKSEFALVANYVRP